MEQIDFASLRRQMIERQLRPRGIADPRVLAAIAEVPREEFVPAELREHAYDDGALPIGLGQTISQPFVVAFMAEVAGIGPNDRVLEVGTGSGYAAAVYSKLCGELHTVERLPKLEQQARERLARLGYSNVYTHLVDGTGGLESRAPYAAILVAAAAEEAPRPLMDQLTEGGRLVIPIGPKGGQRMRRYTLSGRTLVYDDLGPFAFVPLIGEHGFKD
jgi:protein-L-isoaspartate(D-aspartate) O-methyltransferase